MFVDLFNFSEANEWTCDKTPIKINQDSVLIKVASQYLPDGIEDKTRITLGRRILHREVEILSIFLWRSNGSIFVSQPGAKTIQEKIQSESSLMELDVKIPVCCLTNEKRQKIYPQLR